MNAARGCGWPPLSVPGVGTLLDDGAWQFAIDGSTPGDRVNMIVALGPHLLSASDGGRLRVASQRERASEADVDPLVVGDLEAVPVVKAALALVPTAVMYALIRDVAFLAGGLSSRAWTSPARFIDAAGRQKYLVINLPYPWDVPLLLHELAHAWCYGPDHELSQAIGAEGEAAFRALAAADGWAPSLEKAVNSAETLADALALSWLYSRPAEVLPA